MKGLFIPGITAEMFRNASFESVAELMAKGKIYDVDYQPPREKDETIGLAKGYCILGLEDIALNTDVKREKINRVVKAINQDMAAHSGTGEEVTQAYCDGLRKSLKYLENIGEVEVNDKD